MKRLFIIIVCLLFLSNYGNAFSMYYQWGRKKTTAEKTEKVEKVKVEKGQVDVTVTALDKTGIYNPKKKIKYKVYIKNGRKDEQKGTLYYEITSTTGEKELEKTFDLKLPKKKTLSNDFEIPFEKIGTYQIKFIIILNAVKREFKFSFDFVTGGITDKEAEKLASKKSKEQFAAEIDGELEGEMKITLNPRNVDGVFLGRSAIHYDVTLQNTYKVAQEGTVGYQIRESINGKLVSEQIYDIRMNKSSKKTLNFNISPPLNPGIYNVVVAINTTTYDDTTYYSFGYEIGKMKNPFHRPDDFEDFWKSAMADLAMISPEYKIEEDFEKSTLKHKVYKVEMNSLDNERIFGWLSIPTTLIGSRFPVLVGYGGYHVMLEPLYFDDFASFMLNPRYTDKEKFKKDYPDVFEMLIKDVYDPAKYVYRGIYMDCIRAVDFILANEEMGFDVKRIGVFGGSQGGSMALMVAGLMGNKIQTCMVDNPTYCDFHLNLEMQDQIRGESFILSSFNRYLEENKTIATKEDLLNTLSYYEIQNFVPKIKCSVLLGIGLLDPLAPPVTTIGAFNKLNPEVIKKSEIYTFPTLGHEVPSRHNTFKSIWFYEKLAKGKK